MRARVRWGNVGRAAAVLAVLALAVAWPRLAPPAPTLPADHARPLATPKVRTEAERHGAKNVRPEGRPRAQRRRAERPRAERRRPERRRAKRPRVLRRRPEKRPERRRPEQRRAARPQATVRPPPPPSPPPPSPTPPPAPRFTPQDPATTEFSFESG